MGVLPRRHWRLDLGQLQREHGLTLPYGDPEPPKGFLWRWVRGRRYKLYGDGRFYDLETDPAEHRPIKPGTGGTEAARSKLQSVLDRYDNRELWQAHTDHEQPRYVYEYTASTACSMRLRVPSELVSSPVPLFAQLGRAVPVQPPRGRRTPGAACSPDNTDA